MSKQPVTPPTGPPGPGPDLLALINQKKADRQLRLQQKLQNKQAIDAQIAAVIQRVRRDLNVLNVPFIDENDETIIVMDFPERLVYLVGVLVRNEVKIRIGYNKLRGEEVTIDNFAEEFTSFLVEGGLV